MTRAFRLGFAVAFAALQISPSLSAFVPRTVPPCSLCAATDHGLCAQEGHDCAKASSVQSCCESDHDPDLCSGDAAPKVRDAADSIGHKCPPHQPADIAFPSHRYLPSCADPLIRPSASSRLPARSAAKSKAAFDSPFDRPPAA